MITGREHSPDFKARSATPTPAAWIDPPGAVHLEMGVQCEVVAEPEQLVLATGDHFADANAGQIHRR
jgi:hypothetical protein